MGVSAVGCLFLAAWTPTTDGIWLCRQRGKSRKGVLMEREEGHIWRRKVKVNGEEKGKRETDA